MGSDSSASGSANEPFKTINRAINGIRWRYYYSIPGTYNEDVNFKTKSITLSSIY